MLLLPGIPAGLQPANQSETQPNFAHCIHFIRNGALHVSILIPCTSCCRPQIAYGAEYAVMNNKPQFGPKSVIFPAMPVFSKFDVEVNFWISNLEVKWACLVKPWTLSESWLYSDNSYKENMVRCKKKSVILSPNWQGSSSERREKQMHHLTEDTERNAGQDSTCNISDPITNW